MPYLLFSFLQLLFLVVFMIVLASLLYSEIYGAPWVRTPQKNLDTILEKVNIPKNSTIIELGCGTGVVLRALCKKSGSHGIGVDINPLLIWVAGILSKFEKNSNVKFVTKNIYDYPLHKSSVIYLFLMPKMLEKLRPKLENELQKGAIIISLGFKIPGWDKKIVKTILSSPYTTYLYQVLR